MSLKPCERSRGFVVSGSSANPDAASIGAGVRSLSGEEPMRQITDLVVHCSATQAGKSFRAADIDRWHRDQGWEGIGYHFVIALDGSIEQGRPLEEAGAHVAGYNANSIGVCLIGGLDAHGKPADTFNERQLDALEILLRGLRGKWPAARILGHRDFPGVKKACPSFEVRSWCASRGLKA